MYQWRRRIRRALGYEAGIIGDGVFDPRPVTCTTYHSASLHMGKLGDRFKLLVFDEEQHLPSFEGAATMSAAPWRLGLSATPERGDGRHVLLDELIGPVCHRQDISEAMGSVLADCDVFRIPIYLPDAVQEKYDRLGELVRRFRGMRSKMDPSFDFEKWKAQTQRNTVAKAAWQAYWQRRSIENRAPGKLRVLEDLFLLHPGVPTIVFVGSSAMAHDLSRRYWIPTILSDCGKRERAEILARFADGRYPAIVANRLLDEGIDVPEAKVAVILGGTGAPSQFIQRRGRVLRRAGGQRAVVYEVVCEDTGEVRRSANGRRNDAYKETRNFRF
jgi:superfamily II DNA or RNA helicase